VCVVCGCNAIMPQHALTCAAVLASDDLLQVLAEQFAAAPREGEASGSSSVSSQPEALILGNAIDLLPHATVRHSYTDACIHMRAGTWLHSSAGCRVGTRMRV
jgi:hypothetical protein